MGSAIFKYLMIDQPLEVSPIVIEDDVWIRANCTITKGGAG